MEIGDPFKKFKLKSLVIYMVAEMNAGVKLARAYGFRDLCLRHESATISIEKVIWFRRHQTQIYSE